MNKTKKKKYILIIAVLALAVLGHEAFRFLAPSPCPAESAIVRDVIEKKNAEFCLVTTADGREILHGPYREYYSTDGKPSFWQRVFGGSKKITQNYKMDEKDGKKTVWNPKGQVLERSFYKDDRREGSYERYSDQGILKENAQFKKDKMTGYRHTYFNDGRMSLEEHYKDSVKDGPYTYYYPDGQVREEGNFLEGVKFGITTTYHKNHIKASQGKLEMGRKHGRWLFWDGNGVIFAERDFKHGVLVSQVRSWHKNGKPRIKEFFEKSQLSRRMTFDDIGVLLKEEVIAPVTQERHPAAQK